MKQIIISLPFILFMFSCSMLKKTTLDIPAERLDSVVDKRNGHVYKTVKILDQWWMMENLNIGEKISGDEEQTNNDEIEKFCYKNDSLNCQKYGGLYQWEEVMQYQFNDKDKSIKGICPDGWHVPTDKEWMEMEIWLGMHNTQADDIGFRGITEGDKLKVIEKCNQEKYCNMSGFSALMGGRRDHKGYFFGINVTGNFWTATSTDENKAWFRQLSSSSPQVKRDKEKQSSAYYVRCVKNE